MRQGSSPPRFFVSPWGFDNIGKVLNKMGQGFEHEKIGWRTIKSLEGICDCDVLFINCALRFLFGYGKKIAQPLRDFVAQGGVVYASDWAVAGVQAAFPDMLEFDMDGKPGQMPCSVIDRGLQEIVGKQVDVHFDTTWWRMTKVNSAVRVYVEALAKNQGQRLPIIIGFRHGDGHVICTAFHNKAQVSDQESRLLRFLVLQPVLAHAAAATADAIQEQHCEPGKEIFATVDRGGLSQPFIVDAEAGSGLLYFVSWSGVGALRLVVRDPSGKVHFDREANRPPLGCEVSRAAAGRWTCQVIGTDLPHDNFPFVLTIATSRRVDTAISAIQPTPKVARLQTAVESLMRSAKSGGMTVRPPPPPHTARKPSVTATSDAQMSDEQLGRIRRPPPPRRPNC